MTHRQQSTLFERFFSDQRFRRVTPYSKLENTLKTTFRFTIYEGLVRDVAQTQAAWQHLTDSLCPIPGRMPERLLGESTGQGPMTGIHTGYGMARQAPSFSKANGAGHAESQGGEDEKTLPSAELRVIREGYVYLA